MARNFDLQQHGLICAFHFAESGIGDAVGLDTVEAWLTSGSTGVAPSQDNSFIWLHFDLTDAGAVPWMQQHLTLAPEFFEAMRQGSRSTRIEMAEDSLIAVVNDVAYDFRFDPSDIATLWVSVNSRIAVSARVHPLRSIDHLREDVRRGARFSSTTDLLNHLMRDQADVLTRIVREATLKVDGLEDRLLAGRLGEQRFELGKVRRLLVRLQRLLAPEPGALFRLLRQPPAWTASHDLDELRQSTEEFSLVLRDLTALQERIKLLQEEIAAQVSEQTNRSLFMLTMVTVLALPINITTGFFGMNVGGIPFASGTHGFVVVVLLVAVFTAIAAWWAFGKSRER